MKFFHKKGFLTFPPCRPVTQSSSFKSPSLIQPAFRQGIPSSQVRTPGSTKQIRTKPSQSIPPMAVSYTHLIVHYSATPESDRAVTGQGFLLADTGGHYYTGTTDCTRTYALGPLSEQEKTHYTAVLRGNLALADATFKAGCTGSNLDYACLLYTSRCV